MLIFFFEVSKLIAHVEESAASEPCPVFLRPLQAVRKLKNNKEGKGGGAGRERERERVSDAILLLLDQWVTNLGGETRTDNER